MKKLLFTFLMTVLAASVYAQPKNGFDSNLGTYDRVTVHGPYLTNRFFDNWFIGVAGGVNLYFGTNDTQGDFGKRLAPALDVSLGKWITPNVGIRLQYAGLEARGFSKWNSPYSVSSIDDSYYKEKFNLISVQAQVLYNLSNAIGGFRNDRTWNFVVFAGFGYAQSNKNGNRDQQIAPSAGLLNNIRLSNVIDLTLEARGLMVKSNFDGVGDKTWVEGNLSLTAGLTFKLGPKGGFKRPVYVAPADYTPYQNRINSLESDLSGARSEIDRLSRELNDCRNRPATVTVDSKCIPATISAFFTIGKANISDKDMVNLEHIASAIKSNPDKKFNVTGSADSNTGSASLNQRLSEQRAENVANALVNMGVNRSQLNVKGIGGVHAERNPALHRVVVIEQAD